MSHPLNNTQKITPRQLAEEIEQLIMHAEDDSLDYSVLEHARKLVFQFNIENQENFDDLKVHEMGHLNEDGNSER